jgi:phosphoenolpyruvate synthase/pyruvate phosphate dikinase
VNKYILVLLVGVIFVVFVSLSLNNNDDATPKNQDEDSFKYDDSNLFEKFPVLDEIDKSDKVIENAMKNMESKTVKVEENTSSGYRKVKIVEDINELHTLKNIIKNAKWEENVKAQMRIPPDYRFVINSYFFAFWITPSGDKLEATIEGDNTYIMFTQEESETLYKLMSDQELD